MLAQPVGFEQISKAYNDVLAQPGIREVVSRKGNSLSFQKRKLSANLQTTKFQHYYQGLEVVGSMAVHHVGKNGVQTDDALARFDLDLNPTLSQQDAIGIVKNRTGDQDLTDMPELKILPAMGGADTNSARLVYWAKVKPAGFLPARELIIDAHSGAVIGDLSDREDLVEVYSGANQAKNLVLTEQQEQHPNQLSNSLIYSKCQVLGSDGYPDVINLNRCQQLVSDSVAAQGADAAAVRALNNAQTVLAYWQSTHGRNSYDDQGATVHVIVHAGIQMANAFWDGTDKLMAYGDGDGLELGDMTQALDVAGHEMTHAVTWSEVSLVHMWESGAVDEALADFFGLMTSNPDNWVLGKAVFLNPATATGIRNPRDPGSIQTKIRDANGNKQTISYPASMAQEIFPPPTSSSCDGTNDLCYIHINSTIVSHAAYLIHEAIGHDNAQKLFYLVQQHYLTPQETFNKIAVDTYNACQQLFDNATCSQVKDAYAQVGLDATAPSPAPKPLI